MEVVSGRWELFKVKYLGTVCPHEKIMAGVSPVRIIDFWRSEYSELTICISKFLKIYLA